MTLNLETVRLGFGNHAPGSSEPCVMEAAALLAGEPWNDHPACVSPVITAFLIRWNDDLGDEDRQMLRPYVRTVLGTNTGAADDDRRAWMATDWLVRMYLTAWLRVAKLDTQAAAIELLPELTDAACWESSRTVVEEAMEVSDAAGDAAGDAAWDASGDAACDAAGEAAWAASRSSAAAISAARDEARDAAWTAATGAAAGAATWDAARATVVHLQKSALDLLDRMIAVGKAA